MERKIPRLKNKIYSENSNNVFRFYVYTAYVDLQNTSK